jgi:hypothetical protein
VIEQLFRKTAGFSKSPSDTVSKTTIIPFYGSPANPCVLELKPITFVLKNHYVRTKYFIRISEVCSPIGAYRLF